MPHKPALDATALLCVFFGADLEGTLKMLKTAVLTDNTERLYLRISRRYAFAARLKIQKAIRKALPKQIEMDVVAVPDASIRYLDLYHDSLAEVYPDIFETATTDIAGEPQ